MMKHTTLYIPEYRAVLARAQAAGLPIPPASRRTLENNFIKTLIEENLWSTKAAIWLPCAHHREFARINIRNPSEPLYTYVGGTNVTHTPNEGTAGNGSSSYINTNYIISGSLMSASNICVTCNVFDDAQGAGVAFGVRRGSLSDSRGQTELNPRNTSNNAFYAALAQANGTNEYLVANSNSKGYWVLRKTTPSNSNNLSLRKDKTSIVVRNDPNNSNSYPLLETIKIHASNNNTGGIILYDNRTVSSLMIGSFISATLANTETDIFNDFFNAINS
jgi:hypothetical protein